MADSLIVTELRRLAACYGGTITPAQVVEAAADRHSPLHRSFEWDDTKAAAAHRLHQARQLLRVHVTVLRPDTKPVNVFVSLKEDRGREGYRLMADVLTAPERRAQLLSDAADELRTFRRKYASLQELSAVFAAIDALPAFEESETIHSQKEAFA